jgi:hypothetical protein
MKCEKIDIADDKKKRKRNANHIFKKDLGNMYMIEV